MSVTDRAGNAAGRDLAEADRGADASSRVQAVRVAPAETFAVREAVLGRTPTPGEDDPARQKAGDGHFAVYEDGKVVATGVVLRREPWGSLLSAGPAWHLLGMAVVEGSRGHGYGTLVLQSALDHVARHGGGTVWCHARERATALYERHGFIAGDDEYDDAVGGRQRFMTRVM